MIVSLDPHRKWLADNFGIVTIAVCKLGETAGDPPAGITAYQEPNGRMSYAVIHGNTEALTKFLGTHNITPSWWIQLRTYNQYVPKHHQPVPDEIDGDHVAVKTGGLIGSPYCYIAVQVKRADQLDRMFERVLRELDATESE